MSESDKYDVLPCEAEIVVNEQLLRYGLSTHLSSVSVEIASAFADVQDVVLQDACTVDGVPVDLHFGNVVLTNNTSQVVLKSMFEDGLCFNFSVTLSSDMAVEQRLHDPFA